MRRGIWHVPGLLKATVPGGDCCSWNARESGQRTGSPAHLLPCSLPFPRPTERNEVDSVLLPLSLCLLSSLLLLLLAQMRLCEGWELCHQEPTGESTRYSCKDKLRRKDRKLGYEPPPHPRPGPAPNVTIWGWGPHPLPLREAVKAKMPKSREKSRTKQEPRASFLVGCKSVTVHFAEW